MWIIIIYFCVIAKASCQCVSMFLYRAIVCFCSCTMSNLSWVHYNAGNIMYVTYCSHNWDSYVILWLFSGSPKMLKPLLWSIVGGDYAVLVLKEGHV